MDVNAAGLGFAFAPEEFLQEPGSTLPACKLVMKRLKRGDNNTLLRIRLKSARCNEVCVFLKRSWCPCHSGHFQS